jgi:tetratricopeptide (TPR) repeat protein
MILKIQIIVTILLFMVIASSCNNEPDKWYYKGLDLGTEGKYDEAIQCYDKAIEIDPKHVYAWYNKGLALYYMGKYEEAIKCYDEAIKLAPEYTSAKTSKQEALRALDK